jgi:hypothetical protein
MTVPYPDWSQDFIRCITDKQATRYLIFDKGIEYIDIKNIPEKCGSDQRLVEALDNNYHQRHLCGKRSSPSQRIQQENNMERTQQETVLKSRITAKESRLPTI